MSTLVYSFRIDNEHGEELTHVWSYNMQDVRLFLTQHKFNKESFDLIKAEIKNHHTSEHSELYQLKNTKFRSNESNETFNIMTTMEILIDSIENMLCEYEGSMIFKDCIGRTDYPIIKVINDLIFLLPYAMVANHCEFDAYYSNDEQKAFVNGDNMKYLKVFSSQNPDEGYSDSFEDGCVDDCINYTRDAINHAFEFRLYDNDPLPITLEGYVKGFVELVGGDLFL